MEKGGLAERLGDAMKAEDMARYLQVGVRTVIKHFKELGGIRLGRQYFFFEREVIDAVQKRRKMDGPSESEWEEEGKNLSDEEGGDCLGEHDTKEAGDCLAEKDRYGLLN